MKENNTWTLVKAFDDATIIDSKWAFSKKVVGDKIVKKAPLVVNGFQQCDLIEDV